MSDPIPSRKMAARAAERGPGRVVAGGGGHTEPTLSGVLPADRDEQPSHPLGRPVGDYTKRAVWLMSLRVVIITTLLLSALLVQAITNSIFSELNPIYYLVGSTYVLTLVYASILSLRLWQGWFLQAQLTGDLLIVTGLIYYSGGLGSAFPFLYVLPIITGGILLESRGGLWIGVASCILYGMLVALIHTRLIPPATGFLATSMSVPLNQVYFNLFVRWLGFLGVAMLSIYLAEKLREAGREVEAKSADLEQLQVFYEDIINSVDSGLLSTDLGGRVRSLNFAGERILQREHSQVIGKSVYDVLGRPGKLPEDLSSAGAAGARFEQQYDASPGGTKHLEVVVARLLDRANAHRGFTVVFRDLTLLKALEREVRVNERMAAVGEMAAGLAHEIRNPLASVSGSIQVLRGDLALEAEQRSLMDIVVGESNRLNRIVEEFLCYAKPAPPMPQRVDICLLVEETITLLRNDLELGERYRIESSLSDAGVILEADADQLRQVFWNVLRNGIQAMPDGGTLIVSVELDGDDGVSASIEDEGSGFADEELDYLWEPFHTRRARGVGLGLSIVYRIIREHGGRVALSNRATGGGRVIIWLPLSWRGGPSDRRLSIDPRRSEEEAGKGSNAASPHPEQERKPFLAQLPRFCEEAAEKGSRASASSGVEAA